MFNTSLLRLVRFHPGEGEALFLMFVDLHYIDMRPITYGSRLIRIDTYS